MKYYIEIYLDGDEDTVDFQAEGSTAFPTLSAGDIIVPLWREGPLTSRQGIGAASSVLDT